MAGKVEEETAGGHSGETISSLLFRVELTKSWLVLKSD
ncbi:predicted protein [Histoplasma mississippiense (nom. inval.)]|nr:predicted protein [Histoplasma mississippiense (nom. inval.)]EDN06199.1 predicted protein [Histoplasma mississippiense (nom. inval.)]